MLYTVVCLCSSMLIYHFCHYMILINHNQLLASVLSFSIIIIPLMIRLFSWCTCDPLGVAKSTHFPKRVGIQRSLNLSKTPGFVVMLLAFRVAHLAGCSTLSLHSIPLTAACCQSSFIYYLYRCSLLALFIHNISVVHALFSLYGQHSTIIATNQEHFCRCSRSCHLAGGVWKPLLPR